MDHTLLIAFLGLLVFAPFMIVAGILSTKAAKERLRTETDKNSFEVLRSPKNFVRLLFAASPMSLFAAVFFWALTSFTTVDYLRFPVAFDFAFFGAMLLCCIGTILFAIHYSWKLRVHGNVIRQTSKFRPERVFSFDEIKEVKTNKTNDGIILCSDRGPLFTVKKLYLGYSVLVGRLKELGIEGSSHL